ncbi:MAG: glycosyltransferase [Acidobacteriota bacterium]
MRVTLVSTFDGMGGAGIAAMRLLEGLRRAGHEAEMIVREKKGEDPNVHAVDYPPPELVEHLFVLHRTRLSEIEARRTPLSRTWFSLPYPGCDLSRTHLVRQADVINLHWVSEFQSVETIARLLALPQPLVWTLHDENPFTCGCHYTAGCDGFREPRRDCPQLLAVSDSWTFEHLQHKIRLFDRRLTLVAPSRWLAERARASRVFSRQRVEVIPNALDTGAYFPLGRSEARRVLGWQVEGVVLLFGSFGYDDERKGRGPLRSALELALAQGELRSLAAAGRRGW